MAWGAQETPWASPCRFTWRSPICFTGSGLKILYLVTRSDWKILPWWYLQCRQILFALLPCTGSDYIGKRNGWPQIGQYSYYFLCLLECIGTKKKWRCELLEWQTVSVLLRKWQGHSWYSTSGKPWITTVILMAHGNGRKDGSRQRENLSPPWYLHCSCKEGLTILSGIEINWGGVIPPNATSVLQPLGVVLLQQWNFAIVAKNLNMGWILMTGDHQNLQSWWAIGKALYLWFMELTKACDNT